MQISMAGYDAIGRYWRVSSGVQDIERQRDGTDRFALQCGFEYAKTYEDSEGINSRDLAEDPNVRRAFKDMIRDAEDGKIDCIVVDQLDRFGMKSSKQWMSYMDRLGKAGCDLVDIEGNVWTAEDFATIIQGVVKMEQSRQEQFDKSWRGLSGKHQKAIEGKFQGGYPAYGLDVVCFGPDGKEKWRAVYDSHSSLRKVYPDGKIEVFSGWVDKEGKVVTDVERGGKKRGLQRRIPQVDAGDVKRVRPSIDQERLEVVRKIFTWFTTEQVSPGEIAKRLNKLRVPALYTDKWYKMKVKAILTNPNYTGRYVWNKVSKGRFTERVNGSHVKYDKMKGRLPKQRNHAKSDFSVSGREFEAIVDDGVFEAAEARLKMLGDGKTRKAARNPAYWLKPFLYCGKCNAPMTGMGAQGVNKASYFCGSYNTGGPDACDCNRVNHEKIERLLMAYLAEKEPAIAARLSQVEQMDPETVGSFVTDMIEAKIKGCAIEQQIIEALKGSQAKSYEEIVGQVGPEMDSAVKAKEAELADVIEGYKSAKSAAVRAMLDGQIAVLETEIEDLRSRAFDLRKPLADVATELTQLRVQFAEVQATLTGSESFGRKTKAVSEVIRKTVLHFEKTGKRSKLVKADFYPVAGDVSPTTVSMSDAENVVNENRSLQSFVYNLLFRSFCAEEIGQINPPTGTSRKNARFNKETQRKAGKKAAAARWAKAKELGRVDSRTTEARRQQCSRAGLARWVKHRRNSDR